MLLYHGSCWQTEKWHQEKLVPVGASQVASSYDCIPPTTYSEGAIYLKHSSYNVL